MPPKVVLETTHLTGSGDSQNLQLIATVYWGEDESRVYAPPRAKGLVTEWVGQSSVRSVSGLDEVALSGGERLNVLNMLQGSAEWKSLYEQPLSVVTTEKQMSGGNVDRRKVFVVHGRNMEARDALFEFLRAINLDPIEWGEAIHLTGHGSPYIGQAIDEGFKKAHAAVVLLTGDDVARIGQYYVQESDNPDDKGPTPQARLNVVFEAGIGFGKFPDRTIMVQLGKCRPLSDTAGRHIIHLNDAVSSRQSLADRLRTAGCDVKTEHKTDWHTAGKFIAAKRDPDAAKITAKPLIKIESREAKTVTDPKITYKDKVWINLKNVSTQSLHIKHPVWSAGDGGIRAKIVSRTLQIDIEGEWCPHEHGATHIHVAPGERFRMWIQPLGEPMDSLERWCNSSTRSIGQLTLDVNGAETTVVV